MLYIIAFDLRKTKVFLVQNFERNVLYYISLRKLYAFYSYAQFFPWLKFQQVIIYAQSQKPYWAFLLEHLFFLLSFISLFFNLYFVTSVFVILEAYLKSFLKLYGVKYIFKLKSHLLIGQTSSLWGCIDTYLSNGVTLTLPELHWQANEKNLSK